MFRSLFNGNVSSAQLVRVYIVEWRMTVNNEFRRKLKKVVAAYFKLSSKHSSSGLRIEAHLPPALLHLPLFFLSHSRRNLPSTKGVSSATA
jgi:hypothetical protein